MNRIVYLKKCAKMVCNIKERQKMKTFIINLKNSVDRRLKIEGQLNALSIDHEFIEAVNGKAMSTEELANMTKKTNYAFLPGEIGCALSHQKIYKKMIDENIDSALILEDDVTLLDGFSEVIRKITLPENSPTVILLSRVNKYYKKPLKNITVNLMLVQLFRILWIYRMMQRNQQ